MSVWKKFCSMLPRCFSVEESMHTRTRLTINGREVDPDSPEGRKALQQIEDAKQEMQRTMDEFRKELEEDWL